MSRQRKKHVQQAFEFRTHGEREEIDPRHPLHITTRVLEDLGSLRKKDIFIAIRAATIVVFERSGFHLVHASIQASHLHLIVEATNKSALAGGLRVFLSSAAKRINRALTRRCGRRRRGKVFADRYHPRPMTNPRAVRHTVSYVLNNWRRHGEDLARFAAQWQVDPYSSGVYFQGWAELGDSPIGYRPREGYFGLMTWLPKTWLLRVGWMKSGSISNREVPGRA